jgi:hypothetical protein
LSDQSQNNATKPYNTDNQSKNANFKQRSEKEDLDNARKISLQEQSAHVFHEDSSRKIKLVHNIPATMQTLHDIATCNEKERVRL